jgi:hypothetical protein
VSKELLDLVIHVPNGGPFFSCPQMAKPCPPRCHTTLMMRPMRKSLRPAVMTKMMYKALDQILVKIIIN